MITPTASWTKIMKKCNKCPYLSTVEYTTCMYNNGCIKDEPEVEDMTYDELCDYAREKEIEAVRKNLEEKKHGLQNKR